MTEVEKTYTEQDINNILNVMKERQETLEALECAYIIMTETKQYPRFINRINHLIKSVEGNTNQQVEEKPEKKKLKPLP